MGQVHSPKKCRVTMYDTGLLQEYANKKSATEIDDECDAEEEVVRAAQARHGGQ